MPFFDPWRSISINQTLYMKTILFVVVLISCIQSVAQERSYGDLNGILHLDDMPFRGTVQEFCDTAPGISCPRVQGTEQFIALTGAGKSRCDKQWKWWVYTQDPRSKRWYCILKINKKTVRQYGGVVGIHHKNDEEITVLFKSHTFEYKKPKIKEPFLAEWTLVQH